MSQHDDRDLVEPEGVNAASDEASAEGAGPVAGADDVRSGGRPEAAPPAEQHDQRPSDDEMAGAPGTDPTDPGQQQASAAHDSGSAR